MTRYAIALAMLAGGCDKVFGVDPVPDAEPNQLGCALRPSLLCADFEEDTTYYSDSLARDIPMAVANQTVSIAAPGVHGGHALYITSMGPTYRLEARSPTPATKITATFELDLAQFDAATPATSLAVLFFENAGPSQCYVAIDFQPMSTSTPPRLNVVANCGTMMSIDLAVQLPKPGMFVPITFTMDLGEKTGLAQLGTNMLTIPIAPTVAMAPPGAVFGFIDPVDGSTASVGLDDVLATVE